MADPTFAEQMVTKIQGLLLKLGGLESATIDGVSHKYADLKRELAYWEKKVAREAGTCPPIATIGLNGTNF